MKPNLVHNTFELIKQLVGRSKLFESSTAINFLFIGLNLCQGCSKELR